MRKKIKNRLFRALQKIFLKFSSSRRLTNWAYAIVTIIFLVLLIASPFRENQFLGTIAGIFIGFVPFYISRGSSHLTEDASKINNDYNAGEKRYSYPSYKQNFSEVTGSVSLGKNTADWFFLFDPIECVSRRKPRREPLLCIDEKEYIPDTFILSHLDDLAKAHPGTKMENSLLIRLDDIKRGEYFPFYETAVSEPADAAPQAPAPAPRLTATVSKTTNIYSLLTNRSADVDINGSGLTIRNLYEPGPRLRRLRDSALSDHIGIQCMIFVKDTDGKLYGVFCRRGSGASINKLGIVASIGQRIHWSEAQGKGDDSLEPIRYWLSHRRLIQKFYPFFEPCQAEEIEKGLHYLGCGREIFELGRPQFFYSYTLVCDEKHPLDSYVGQLARAERIYRLLQEEKKEKEKEKEKIFSENHPVSASRFAEKKDLASYKAMRDELKDEWSEYKVLHLDRLPNGKTDVPDEREIFDPSYNDEPDFYLVDLSTFSYKSEKGTCSFRCISNDRKGRRKELTLKDCPIEVHAVANLYYYLYYMNAENTKDESGRA